MKSTNRDSKRLDASLTDEMTEEAGRLVSRRLEWYTNFSIEVIPLITSTGAHHAPLMMIPRPGRGGAGRHTRDS